MPPIDGRLVKAKRFPVHAAATVCAMGELQRLLTEDAAFHVGRKIPDLELSVLHSACSSRHGSPNEIFGQIVKLLIEVFLLLLTFLISVKIHLNYRWVHQSTTEMHWDRRPCIMQFVTMMH